ncbi:hypothetical protein GCM10011611_13470 [Aliidongia dinghuensis]|uniref:Mechanosensitive ion channel n=1 Tax=Aliidongia dinghuensis TaxID=1867774 RepID=A0A8J2YRM4_9PROT|nr:mechanosensitive ion channel family protein [Aliidongia dinghuensis]GGF09259.1 hypothetical protein GCM10011611_13470 [Aliidongia dinghuensis]
MSARLSLGLLVLLLLTPLASPRAAPAEHEREPAIVLQLPPGMTADQVRELVTGLEGKGAAIVPPAQPNLPSEPVIHRILARLAQAVPKAPQLAELPARWSAALAAEPSSGGGFWLRLLGLIVGAWLLELLIRAAVPALIPRLRIRPDMRLDRAFLHHFVWLAAGLVSFIAVVRLGGGLIGRNSPLLIATTARVIDSAVTWRIATGFLALVLSPGLPAARPLYIVDAGARRVYRWVGPYLIYAMVFIPAAWLATRLGADADLQLDIAVGFGLIITLYKTAMFLHVRAPVSAAILVAGGDHPRLGRRLAAALWHWVFILLSWTIFLLAVEQYALGSGTGTGTVEAAGALQAVIVGMSLAWAAKQRFITEYGRHDQVRWWQPVVNRTVDMVVLIGGFAWLATLWGFDVFDPDATGATATVLRPLFRATITLALAWLTWSAIGGFLRERAPHHPGSPIDEDGAVETSMTRLATLLPLIRNVLAIAIFFLGTMIALGDLGVDVGPLLAGAGVVGIALGFGAQALVRDVIAGLFFLIDDAFRLGEYIDTGRLKGTVEAISIRSVRLRHQNGQVHTIPFGQIQAVTNSSRDWAIIKFNLHIAPESDLELVRKTIKQLGLALLEDPEFGQDFIQPLKMQGVADVTQAAVMIRCKFTARPGRPTVLRRQAMRGIIQRFAAAGIAFANPPATASNPP